MNEHASALRHREAKVVVLEKGEAYRPWGTGGHVYTHGLNDGTHGSTLLHREDKNTLNV